MQFDTRRPTILVKVAKWVDDDDQFLPRRGYGYRPGMGGRELYDSARAWWVVSQDRAQEYRYLAALNDGRIVGVWEIDPRSWRSRGGDTGLGPSTRWAVEGSVPDADVVSEFVGRTVPDHRPDGRRLFGSGNAVGYWPS